MTDLIKFSPNALEEKTTVLTETVAYTQEMVISDQDQLTEENLLLKDLKAELKAIQEMKESATKPLNESLNTIRSWFRPLEDLGSQAEQYVKGKIAAFILAERVKAEEATKLQLVAADNADYETLTALVEVAPVAPVAKGTSVREVWVARVLDADKVPREYCLVDEKRIQAIARACKSEGALPKIPGVVFEKKAQVTSR
jgi:hypothetical protein